ncbi:Nucleoporin NUP85 [Operophtera brumata]|uniref:Nuclear pore complex protein Nup85 n=1 Tax=Operophtera brumata TaxID=104452 RepID=A0A0L7LIH9_OPEBR|nr:Nucleoporin NUP85 [Operophtera brumata]
MNELETRSFAKTFNLPEKCLENRIGCTWGRGNQFTIYPRSQTVSQAPLTTENKLLSIHREILLFHPILRRLVNESNGTFLAIQKAAEAAKSSDNHVEFLKLSRQYRSIIRVCIESLQEASQKTTDGIEKNNLLAYVTIFYSIECIWHLCEILHVDNIPGDIVLPFLLEWVRFHFPCHEQTAARLLEACERGSEDHEDYWDTVIGMIVQGRVYGSISTGEFTVTWKHWQAECRAKLISRVFTTQPQLELILKRVTCTSVTNRLRESLILDYGCLLTEHNSLWPVGLSYLVICGGEGQRRAELMLERLPLHSEAKAMRVLCEARKHGLLGVVKYCDFHRLYKNREFKKAADLLVSLITSKIAPDYFWDTLLLDALPLLECDSVVLSAAGTCAVMQCLERRSAALQADSAALLRLALARNLARAALAETMDTPE